MCSGSVVSQVIYCMLIISNVLTRLCNIVCCDGHNLSVYVCVCMCVCVYVCMFVCVCCRKLSDSIAGKKSSFTIEMM